MDNLHPRLAEAFAALQKQFPALEVCEVIGPEVVRLKGKTTEGLLVKGRHRSAEVTLDAACGRQMVGLWTPLLGWHLEWTR